MKKIYLTIAAFYYLLLVNAQTTYTWKGTTGSSYATASNWNPARTASSTSDILVFDGFTGTVSMAAFLPETIGQLIFKNGATVTFSGTPVNSTSVGTITRNAASVLASATTTNGSPVVTTSTTTAINVGAFVTAGTGVLTGGSNFVTAVNAGTSFTMSSAASASATVTNIAISQPITGFSATPSVGDFIFTGTGSNFEQITSNIDAATALGQNTSTIAGLAAYKTSAILTISGNGGLLSVESGSSFTMSCTAPFIIKLNNGATGTINGNLSYGSATDRIIIDNNSSSKLSFKNGSIFDTGTSTGTPFGSLPNSTNDCVVFEAGATYKCSGSPTANSPNALFGAYSGTSVVSMQKGSIYLHNTTYSMAGFSHRSYPNVIWASTATTIGIPSTTPMDTVTINAGTTCASNSNSYFIIKGDLIVNGTLDNTGKTPVYLFCGSVPQNITGTGTFAGNGLCKLFVTPNATLNLGTNIVQNGGGYTYNFGTLNFGTYTISNTNSYATATTVLRGQPTTTSSNSITGIVYAGSPYIMNITSGSITGFNQGMELYDSTGGLPIPANTELIYPSGLQLSISNPLSPGTYVVKARYKSTGSAFSTASPGGILGNYPLPTNGVFGGTGTPGCSYTFNAPTTTPFPVTTSFYTSNVSLASDVSSNVTNLYITGALNLNNNTFSIPESDTLRITNGTAIQGTSSSKFISLGANVTSGARGALKISNISAPTLFPIGTNGNYLPVTITPAGTAEDYTISAFNGATVNALPNGTPFDATKKATIVDAVWTIKANTTPSGAVGVQFGWPASLEGSAFTGYANNQIGIANYTTDWSAFATATADNTANTASANQSSFGSFIVGNINTILPVKFTSITATSVNGGNKVSWQVATEISVDKYIVESSTDGIHFSTIGFVKATASSSYSFVDIQPSTGTNYYRILAQDFSGSGSYSSVVNIGVSLILNYSGISVYPNPIVNHTVNIAIYNNQAANYTVQIIDPTGKIIVNKYINHTGVTSNYSIELPSGIATGNYFVTVKDITKTVLVKYVLIK
jgi:hypothetical protein